MKRIIVLIILMSLCFGLWGGDLDDSAIVDGATIQPEFWTDLYNALNGDSTYDNLIPTFRKVTVDTLTNGTDVIDSTGIKDLSGMLSREEVIMVIEIEGGESYSETYLVNYDNLSCQISEESDSTIVLDFNALGGLQFHVGNINCAGYFVYTQRAAIHEEDVIITLYDSSWNKVFPDALVDKQLSLHFIWN